eukprot:833984-Prorocentrum_minimum.AAC.1
MPLLCTSYFRLLASPTFQTPSTGERSRLVSSNMLRADTSSCHLLVTASLLSYTQCPAGVISTNDISNDPTLTGWISMAVYLLFYLALEPVAGLTWFLTHGVAMYSVATWMHHQNRWQLAVALHVLSWYMQIHPGHAVFERRKPALMDSLVQAFAMAPLFVHMEVLFWMGYRPALQARIAQEVARRVSQMDGGDLHTHLVEEDESAEPNTPPSTPPEPPRLSRLRHDHNVHNTP